VARLRSLFAAIWIGCLVVTVAVAATEAPLPPEQVVTHVSRTISWYRRITALQQLPVDAEDVVPRDRLSQTALTATRLALEFGRAAASLAAKKLTTPGNTGDESQSDAQNEVSATDRAAAQVAARIAELQSQLSTIDAELPRTRAKDRATLTAKRGEIAAALDLTKEVQTTVTQIQRFEDSTEAHTGSASGGLGAQIDDLRKSVPELRTGANLGTGGAQTAASAAAPASSAGSASNPSSPPAAASASSKASPAPVGPVNTETFRPESAGVIALLGKWFSLEGSRRQLADTLKQTEGLQKDLDAIREAVTKDARELAQQNLQATSADPAQLLQSKLKLQDAGRRFREISTLLIPIGEQRITLDNARATLDEWRESLGARIASIARYLALRLIFLLGSVAVVLVVSEVWRRATFRYLHDIRRRQQFLALRRVAVGIALTVVIMFGLVSEVGSLATYAGLITAGLAVALQNVILAVVAYFFLIGRYGVRVGDRVTMSGVTGRVVEIGLVRIYLLELAGPQLRSTGRMVVLSNAVLFQPTALFKQLPGSDFFWHTVKLTLAPTTDVEIAQKRLSEAAESVYQKYRPAIEQQHAALQRVIDFQTAMPAPEAYVRLTAKGLEFTVRYPVDPSQAASTDQKMLLALREAQAKEPPLEVLDGPLVDTAD